MIEYPIIEEAHPGLADPCGGKEAAMPPVAVEAPDEWRVLDSLAALTHHRDIDALDHSLVLTLAELTAAHSVILAKCFAEDSVLESAACCSPDPLGVYHVRPLEPAQLGASLGPMQRCLQRLEVQTETRGGLHRQLVPIVREGRAIGALQLDSALAPLRSRSLIDGFARIYANYTALLHESEHDKLTGLYNRRSLERQLQRMLQLRDTALRPRPFAVPPAREQRVTPPGEAARVWLAIVDIDHFKRINDNYGHIYGDEVILLLAQQMRACFRRGDVLFRFGGEEFVALFSATDEATVHGVLERFRAHVARFAFPLVGHVTISIGYSRIGAHDYPAVALDRADQALYFVKQHGRDGVRGYEELDASGTRGRGLAAGTIDLF
ncbi:GGDEF domain-containing protein [Rhodanobacter lindaniclasticus]